MGSLFSPPLGNRSKTTVEEGKSEYECEGDLIENCDRLSFKTQDMTVNNQHAFEEEEECDQQSKGNLHEIYGNGGAHVMHGQLDFSKETQDDKDMERSAAIKVQKETQDDKDMERSAAIKVQKEIQDDKDTERSAAIKVQKVYRSYRTRRNFADWAVVTEELWWRAIEYATLQKSTEGYFNDAKLDTVESRWTRGKIKAAKVGKGLSEDEKAKLLALEQWLEAIDPQHRYGHNLHFYYVEWFKQQTQEPFFYWLDVGHGKILSLDSCPRDKLRKQRIKYLSPKEREQYEVVVKNGALIHKQSLQVVNTSEGTKWIFVLSTSEQLYIGQKQKGTFQHSSFLAGAAILAAGRLTAEDGTLKTISPYSGHYLPTSENLNRFILFLEKHGVDMHNVEKRTADEESQYDYGKTDKSNISPSSKINKSNQFQNNTQEDGIARRNFSKSNDTSTEIKSMSKQTLTLETNASYFSIENTLETNGNVDHKEVENLRKSLSNIETHELLEEDRKVYYKKSLSSKDLENRLPHLPCKEWAQRLHSAESFRCDQVGKVGSSKWASGTSLRIGCVADYPPELRYEALKQVLSPRPVSS